MHERCTTETCRKRTYAIMKCRCGQIYCGLHLGNHSCTYDYRTEHQQDLSNKNPKVVAPKLQHLITECNMPQ